MDSPLLVTALTALLTHLPVFLVWLAGAIVALVRPSVPRRVVAFLVGGLVAHMAQAVVGTGVGVLLPFRLREGGASMAQVGSYLLVWNSAWNLVSAAAWVLVLLAVFADREPAKG
jgi:hypothetical protein